jgi:hypothetical protein
MSNTYKLVNPLIGGTLKTEIKADNSAKAAKHFYKELSSHIGNSLPQFYFSLQKGGKFYHFKVEEQTNNNEVNYTLSQYNVQNPDTKPIENKIKEMKKQQGGKKHKKKDDDDSSSSSSSESEKYVKHYVPVWNTPIQYLWYDPYVYKVDTVWIPSFVTVPSFELRIAY